jgi:hypothetical protein
VVSLPAFVWCDTTRRWTNPHLGILIARRQGQNGWEGWVISAYEGGSGATGLKVYVMQQWYSFDHLRPVEGIVKPTPDLSGYRPMRS